MRPRRTALALCLALLAALAGCATPAPPAPSTAAVPAARLWIVRDPGALIAALPPLPAVLPAPPPAPADPALAAAWAEPATGWVDAELRAIVAEQLYPTRAARALMLLGVAMGDSVAVAAAARAGGAELSARAAVAAAAARVMAFTHPRLAPLGAADQEAAAWAGHWRGEEAPAAVYRGRLLGAAVADAVLAWAAADGSADAGALPAAPAPGPGAWAPTPPTYEQAQEPGWGAVRTVAIGDPARLRAAAPPAWGSPAMEAQIASFAAAQAGLTDAQRAAARAWAGGAGTVTPPGLWATIARGMVAERGLGLEAAAPIYAALGVALHDAAVACWETKYHYAVARPLLAMRARDPSWSPLLRTPPHPSYPSGHAAFSGAAAAVLAAAFPAEADQLRRRAEEAARSRVYGGIHWPMDGEAGPAQGARVAALVLAPPATP